MLYLFNGIHRSGRRHSNRRSVALNLSGGRSILVSAGSGRILGGNANARNLIEAKVVGSETYVRTELRVGFKPIEKRRLKTRKNKKQQEKRPLQREKKV